MDLWVKSFHIISVIAWMAALLYLPRLFIYHCGVPAGSEQSDTFKVMERRLLRAIATPSMIGTWIFGLWIASLYDVWADSWFLVKFACILAMTGVQFSYVGDVNAFSNDKNQKSERYFRIMNEVPAVLMIIIVVMVVVKPF